MSQSLPKIIQIELTETELTLLINAYSVASAMEIGQLQAALSAQEAFGRTFRNIELKGLDRVTVQNGLMDKLSKAYDAALPHVKAIEIHQSDLEIL